MRPENVISPQQRLRNLAVVYSDPQDGWSVATMEYEHEGVWSDRVGIRWNGDTDQSLGHPQVSGNSVWFLLPENLLAELVLTYARWCAANQ